jgi:flagellar hook-associated protein 2
MTLSSVSGANGNQIVVNGLVSGINTTAVIQALLQGYQAPITNTEEQQATETAQADDYRSLNNDFQAVQTAAEALSTQSSWNLATATTSNADVATATAAAGAQTGSLAFTVNQLAQANVLASSSGVSSEGQIVTTSPSLLVATGAAALGFSGLSADPGLSIGSHTVTVTQASAAATVTGQTALATSTAVVAGANDTVDVTVDGSAYTLTLAAGTADSPTQLAAALDAAATAAGAPVQASVGPTGALQLASARQGSQASLTVTGGDALSTLGLSVGQSATGADAIVSVDGTDTTLSSIDSGQQVTLGAPTGSIVATIAGGPNAAGSLVAAGTADAANVATGSGSLSQVVSAINDSGLAATAAAIQLASGQYILQVSANQTGENGAVTIDQPALAGSPLGRVNTIAEAQDATVSVGGASGYTLSSSSDTFGNLLPGTAITVASTGQATVTVTPDASGEAAKVSTLVAAANKALSDITTLAGYNEATKKAGPLMGSAVVEGLQQQILSIVGSVSGTSTLGDSADVGITLNSDGTLSFDQDAFESAYSANPKAVAALFTQGATFTPSASGQAGEVSLVYAGNDTQTGSYDVTVSHSATQATDAGAAVGGGTIGTAETLTFEQNGISVGYSTSTGESLASVETGLNQVFAAAGLTVTAQLAGGGTQLQVTSNGYGSAQAFQVTSTASGAGTTGLAGPTAGQPVTFAGTDVAGTINGVAATGNGQVLSAPSDDPTLAGFSVLVNAAGISATTDIGTISYRPGVAQQLVSAMNGATDASSGSITSAINTLNAEATGLNSQIAMLEKLESSQQAVLEQEFATMETNLGSLKNESSQLASQIADL